MSTRIFISFPQYGMERDYVGGEKPNYGNHLSCSSLHSDGDSYPNSPINGENIYSMLAML